MAFPRIFSLTTWLFVLLNPWLAVTFVASWVLTMFQQGRIHAHFNTMQVTALASPSAVVFLTTLHCLPQVFARGQDGDHRGLTPGFLLGVKHQELVRGRAPRHRGVYVGKVEGVTAQGGVVLDLMSPVKRGDGVVFDHGGWRGRGRNMPCSAGVYCSVHAFCIAASRIFIATMCALLLPHAVLVCCSVYGSRLLHCGVLAVIAPVRCTVPAAGSPEDLEVGGMVYDVLNSKGQVLRYPESSLGVEQGRVQLAMDDSVQVRYIKVRTGVGEQA